MKSLPSLSPIYSKRPREMLDALLDKLPADYREKILKPAKTVVCVWWKEQPLTYTLDAAEEVVHTAFSKLSKLIGTVNDVYAQRQKLQDIREDSPLGTSNIDIDSNIQRYLNAVRVYLGDLRERMTEGLYVHGYAWEWNVHAAVLDVDTWLAFCQDLAFV